MFSVNQKIDTPLALAVLTLVFIIVLIFVITEISKSISLPFVGALPSPGSTPVLSPEAKGIAKFSSEEEFKSYLEESSTLGETYWSGVSLQRMALPEAPSVSEEMAAGKGGAEPERVSETTVQVLGIDEPDIVKTDGKRIYFSSTYYWPGPVWRGALEEMKIMPSGQEGKTKIIKAFPPEALAKESDIDRTGNLLLSDDILVIFSGNKIYGYDVSNPKSPKEKWDMDLDSRSFLVAARLYKDKIYIVLQNRVDRYRPCPIEPLSVKGTSLTIRCADIYHPILPVPVDVTFSGIVFDPTSGKVEKTVSFVGSSSASVVYMSENNLYITYSYPGDFIGFFYNFLKDECQDIMPTYVLEKLRKLKGYDISDSAKLTELQIILENWQNSLDDDERLKIENELANRLSDYAKEHSRELGKTGIVKIDLDDFVLQATGSVPGTPLNQFALDEYKDYLRIATTISSFWGWGIIRGNSESANDVYVLDKDLDIVGSVLDLGLRERIYSVRFIEDKGYVVTFRQIDPFYVLDLSDPQRPKLKGELKIPGYSSYLHPITKDKILGVGMEGSQVKISLFDVVLPAKPKELAKYNLDEYWSEILSTHHAFLLDKKHEIFFLPGSKGGYVFSYKGDNLKLEKAISKISAKRAIYLDDFLYIIGEDKIVVLDEISWNKVNEINW